MDIIQQDLATYYKPDGGPLKPQLIIAKPGVKVLYVNFAAGQAMALHNHPGCRVILQGMAGTTNVLLDGEQHQLQPQQLLSFSGELQVSPHNAGTEPCAALITLVTVPASDDVPT